MTETVETTSFPNLRFRGKLRPSQEDVVQLVSQKIAEGKRNLYIVAPPGSGKTVLGLYLWAQCVKCPTLVLSPNSAIQAQWGSRTDLFEIVPPELQVVSTDPEYPSLLTSLTYQSVTLPQRGAADLDGNAIELWIDNLVRKSKAKDPEEALIWIEDLKRHNPTYHEERLSVYRKQVRDTIALTDDSFKVLHKSALETLRKLRQRNIGLIILDECHHLLGHWGRVLADICEYLERPLIVGLTATPPDGEGKDSADIDIFNSLLGEIDYEVPVPAVVRDGFLAPYQDLVYFVRPTNEELGFIASADEGLHKFVKELCIERKDEGKGAFATKSLTTWLAESLSARNLGAVTLADWDSFEKRDGEFARAATLFLIKHGVTLPAGVPSPADEEQATEFEDLHILIPILDRYIRHYLRRSAQLSHQTLADELISRLRTFGTQITETGSQACMSPIARVLAYSRSKTEALIPILKSELAVLGEKIRAVVVTDFEKTSAVSAEISHLLDAEAGGAIAAFKVLIQDPATDALNPVLVTGSSVLVDDDLAGHFLDICREWLAVRDYKVRLSLEEQEGFKLLNGIGEDWCPRVYILLITELFQQGLTKCLIGTRGLLGEGWDASKINVLVDLTTVTTAMSVNQLRGRSIRLDADDPKKLANNWDIVCVAPEFNKGLDDYKRFTKKHKTIFGVTDDGAIEKGVGHVHAALTDLRPAGIEGVMSAFNAEMLARIALRDDARKRWKIGAPYHAEPTKALEFKETVLAGTFPPFGWGSTPWSEKSLTLAVSKAVLNALRECQLVTSSDRVAVSDRAGGYVRIFLQNASEQESGIFAAALREAFEPLQRPRYVIPRMIDFISETLLSKLLPQVVGQYFKKRRRRLEMLHAVPSILAKNKDLVSIYQRHWNEHVSPGEAYYAHHGEGAKLVEEALRTARSARRVLQEKELFL